MTAPVEIPSREELERLLTGISSGDWRLCHHLKSLEHDESCGCGYRGGIWSGSGETLICEMGGTPDREGFKIMPEAGRATQLADAAIIAAAPRLARALLRVLEENERLRAALRPFAECALRWTGKERHYAADTFLWSPNNNEGAISVQHVLDAREALEPTATPAVGGAV